MSRDAVSLELIAGIYRAALQPAEWGKILESMGMPHLRWVGFGAHDSPGLFFHNLPVGLQTPERSDALIFAS